MSKADRDNRSNQLNPNNDAYYSSRGIDRSACDDDDDSVIEHGSSFTSGSGPSFWTQPRLHEYGYEITAITLQGVRRHFLVTVVTSRGESHALTLSQRAFHARRTIEFSRFRPVFVEIRTTSGDVVFSSPAPVWQLHRYPGPVTPSLVRRMRRTKSYRLQATQAELEYEKLKQRAGQFCANVLKDRLAGLRIADWRRLKADILARFGDSARPTALDFEATLIKLRELRLDTDGFPSQEEVDRLVRLHEILWRASSHRSPPLDPNVLDLSGRERERFRDYFEESRAAQQLQDIEAWYDSCEPAIQSYRDLRSAGEQFDYERLPKVDDSSF